MAKPTGLIGTLKKLERRTSVTTHPADSFILLLAKKIRRVTEYVARRLLAGLGHTRSLRRTSALRGSRSELSALVLGNGPSIHSLNPDSVCTQQKNGLHVIAVNWFPLSELGKRLVPDILVLSDPSMMPNGAMEPRNAELWSVLRNSEGTQLAAPTTWRASIEQYGNLTREVIYFNDLPLEGMGRSISPIRPRHYLSLTVYKALALAQFLGYREIGILGVDNTMFRGLRVDELNQLVVGDVHFYSKQRADSNMTSFYPNGVADFFYDISLCFLDLKRFFGSASNIYNLDPLSLVDCFRKDDPLGLTTK